MRDERLSELYGDLCDAVCRVALNIPDEDPYKHTSDVSRATAIRILDVLARHGLLRERSRGAPLP